AQVKFDQALRASLEKIVIASRPGFVIGSGGLPLSQLSWLYVLDVFNSTCNVHAFFVTTNASAPRMMKTLAKCYFSIIKKDFVPRYSLSPRQMVILSCIRASHAQDFLFTIPIDGLGQRMNHHQFCSVLCYRIAISMFSEGSLCSSCNVHRMDQWGDHAVYYFSEVGVKFRLNLVRDILVDMCSKVWIMVRKEAPIGFHSEDGKDLRLAVLLLFNWIQGKDTCLDMTDISPFAGMG
nr:beta-myrcene synthase [Tanacetum cinerariifolium]